MIIFNISEDNFVSLFCRNYMFDIIEKYDGNPDVVIDLDTYYVYCPR